MVYPFNEEDWDEIEPLIFFELGIRIENPHKLYFTLDSQ